MADEEYPAKQLHEHFGIDPKTDLLRESEWLREFKTGQKSVFSESKFISEGLQLSLRDFLGKWPLMNDGERIDFAHAYAAKPDMTQEDEKILHFLLDEGDDNICESLAQMMVRMSQPEPVIRFMIARLRTEIDEPANYIQALGLAKVTEAVPAILPYYRKYREAVEVEKTTGVPEDVIFGPVPYSRYIWCCEALWRITGAEEYASNIRGFLNHSHAQVRCWAEMALRHNS
jgi:hypothetical protein